MAVPYPSKTWYSPVSVPHLWETMFLPQICGGGKCVESPTLRSSPHQKYLREWVLGWAWNHDSNILPTLP